MPMRLASVLLCAAALAAAEGAQTPLLVQAGATYLSGDLRQATGQRWGYHLGIASMLAEQGVLGMPTAEIDGRYAEGNALKLYAATIGYAERARAGDRIFLGAGFGTAYLRLRRTDPAAPEGEDDWRLFAKGMLGYSLSDNLFFEATYFHTPRIGGLSTASTSLALGYWF